MKNFALSMITADLDGESEGEVVMWEAGSQTRSGVCYETPETTTSSVKEDEVLYGVMKKSE